MQLSKGVFLFFSAALLLAATSPALATVHLVTIANFFFSPESLSVNVGDTVRWTNTAATMTHSSTSDNAVWDSGPLGPGATFQFQFNSAGDFPYHCSFHPTIMMGNIHVSGGGGGVPCSAISSLAARCIGGGTKTIQARVNLAGSTMFAGQTVTITIDGTPFIGTIISNGTDSRANFSVPGWSVGTHTVVLVDPAGCGLGDKHPICAAGDGLTKADPEWNDDAAWVTAESAAKRTMLLGNYPNPFNPSSSIQYALGEDGQVTLKIYNMLGQLVRTMVDDFQSAGYHQVVWDGRSESGEAVASGIYVYRLTAGNLVETRKMQLMK